MGVSGFNMKKITPLFYLLFLSVFFYGCATAPSGNISSTKNADSNPLNKDHFQQQLSERSTGDTIELSTINGLKTEKRGNRDAWIDGYILAQVDKKLGRTTYQVHSLIEYKDHDKRLFKEVSYNSALGQTTQQASLLEHRISCQGSAYSGCMHTEHVAFNIEQEVMETIAKGYDENTAGHWRYQLTPNAGRSHSVMLPAAEVAAIVEAAQHAKGNL